MGMLFNPPKAPAPPPPPPAPPRLASGGIKEADAAARIAAAGAYGSGYDDTLGPSGIQGSAPVSTSPGKTLLGQ